MSYYLIHTTYLILFVAVLARQICLRFPLSSFCSPAEHWPALAS